MAHSSAYVRAKFRQCIKLTRLFNLKYLNSTLVGLVSTYYNGNI